MIGPKFQPPLNIQEKVLALIQVYIHFIKIIRKYNNTNENEKKLKHWVDLFKNDHEFKAIDTFYSELKSKGVEFPKYNPEAFTALAVNENQNVMKIFEEYSN